MEQFEQFGIARTELLDDLITKSKLAESFGVSERTIERWVRMRQLPKPVRIGGKSLFHVPSVRKHLLPA